MNQEKLIARAKVKFWNRVGKSGECWVWKGFIGKDGYGITSYKTKNLGAHRMAWKLEHGEIPDGLLICHHCDNPSCVRPSHLFLGTTQDNVNDRMAKNRGFKGPYKDTTNWLRGDQHYSRSRPHLLARGERSGSYTKPERRRRGENHGNSIFTETQIVEIRTKYQNKEANQYELAKFYGCRQTAISAIVRRVRWAHVP